MMKSKIFFVILRLITNKKDGKKEKYEQSFRENR